MNIAEILKNAPKGTKLYSPLFGEVKLQSVSDAMIEVRVVVPISKFNFEDLQSNILNALQ